MFCPVFVENKAFEPEGIYLDTHFVCIFIQMTRSSFYRDVRHLYEQVGGYLSRKMYAIVDLL